MDIDLSGGISEGMESTQDEDAIYRDGDISSDATLYNRVAVWALYLGAFLMPLLFLPWTTSVLELNKQIFLVAVSGAALIAWLLGIVISGKLSWRGNSLNSGVAAFLGATLLATLFSIAKFKSLMGLSGSLSDSLLTITALSIFYIVAVNVIDDKGKKLVLLVASSTALALLFGLLNMLGIGIFRYFDLSIFRFAAERSFNTVGSLNSLGLLAAVSLPLFSKLKISTFRNFDVSRLGVILALVILVILNWWALWTVAIAGMVATIAFGSVNKENFRISRFLMPMTVIVLAVFLMVVNFNLPAVKSNLPIEIAPSQGLSWDVAFKAFKENLAFGYGPENFSLAFDQYGASSLANTTLSTAKFFDATSEFFTLAVQGGLVALLALLYLLGSVVWMAVKRVRHSELSKRVEGTLASLAAVMVATFFYPFNITLMFAWYTLMALAVLMLWGEEKREFQIEQSTSLSLISSLGFIGGLVLVLVGAYFSSTSYIADLRYAQAVASENRDEAIETLTRAINWNDKDDRYYRVASQAALDLLAEELNKPSTSADRAAKIQNYIVSSINLARRATEVAPREANNWANLGAVYRNLLGLVDGVEGLAENSYLKAAELRPGDPSFYSQIGSLYLSSAELSRSLAAGGGASASRFQAAIAPALEKAEQNYKKAIELSNNFGTAIYNLGIVYDRQGKLNEAIVQLEKIVPFNSNQPGLAFELGLLYYRAGQKDKAFNELQRAVLLSPDYANARWYLALIYEERKQLDQAIEQLERILNIEVNKNNEVVLNKLNELRAGRISIPPARVLDQEPL